MTLIELSQIARNILIEYKSVTLPSMGTFVMEQSPAEISEDGNSITPPSARVLFDSSETENNKTFQKIVSDYALLKSLDHLSAEGEILILIKEIKMELLDKGSICFPSFGTITFSEDSLFIFEPDPSFDPAANYYGLEKLTLKRVVSESCEKTHSDELQKEIQGVEYWTKKRLPIYKLVIMAVLLFLVVLILMLILFKDDMMPLLERLLYSKEELQFLREYGQ